MKGKNHFHLKSGRQHYERLVFNAKGAEENDDLSMCQEIYIFIQCLSQGLMTKVKQELTNKYDISWNMISEVNTVIGRVDSCSVPLPLLICLLWSKMCAWCPHQCPMMSTD